MQRERRNFDDPFGISCELEKSRSHFRGSGATPAEVSEPSEPAATQIGSLQKVIYLPKDMISSYRPHCSVALIIGLSVRQLSGQAGLFVGSLASTL